MMEGDGMVAVVRGLKDSSLCVTILDKHGQYTLLPNSASKPVPPTYRCNQLSQTSGGEANHCYDPKCDNSVQAIDGRYASVYKTTHCNMVPTSPQIESSEFPPQRPELNRGQGNFEVGGLGSGEINFSPSKAATYKGGLSWPDRGAVFTARPVVETCSFANSLRKYPSMSPDMSNEIVERLINYTQMKSGISVHKQQKHQLSPLRSDSSTRSRKYQADVRTDESPTRERSRKSDYERRYDWNYDVRHMTTRRLRNSAYPYTHPVCPPIKESNDNLPLEHKPNQKELNSSKSVNIETQAEIAISSRAVSTVPQKLAAVKTIAIPPSASSSVSAQPLAKPSKSIQTLNLDVSLHIRNSVQTCVSSIDINDKKNKQNRQRKSKSQEHINLEDEIITLVQDLTSNDDRESIRGELLKKLKNIYNIERNDYKIKFEKCVKDQLLSEIEFNQISDEIVSKINKCKVFNQKTEVYNTETHPYEKNINDFYVEDVIRDWIKDIPIKNKDYLGKSIKKEHLIHAVANKVKNVVINKLKLENDKALRTEILDLIEDIPIAVNNKRYYLNRLATDLVTKIQELINPFPTSRRGLNYYAKTSDILDSVVNKYDVSKEEEVRQFVKKELLEFKKRFNLKVCMESLDELEIELSDIILDSFDYIRNDKEEQIKDEVLVTIYDLLNISEEQGLYFASNLVNNLKEKYKQMPKLKSQSYVIFNNRNSDKNNINEPVEGINDADIESSLEWYTEQVKSKINEWIFDVTTLNPTDNKTKAAVNDLAGDIVDRQKYLEISSNKKRTENEIEHLKYQLFKWINKLVGVNNLETIEHAPELMGKIKSIPVPILTKAQFAYVEDVETADTVQVVNNNSDLSIGKSNMSGTIHVVGYNVNSANQTSCQDTSGCIENICCKRKPFCHTKPCCMHSKSRPNVTSGCQIPANVNERRRLCKTARHSDRSLPAMKVKCGCLIRDKPDKKKEDRVQDSYEKSPDMEASCNKVECGSTIASNDKKLSASSSKARFNQVPGNACDCSGNITVSSVSDGTVAGMKTLGCATPYCQMNDSQKARDSPCISQGGTFQGCPGLCGKIPFDTGAGGIIPYSMDENSTMPGIFPDSTMTSSQFPGYQSHCMGVNSKVPGYTMQGNQAPGYQVPHSIGAVNTIPGYTMPGSQMPFNMGTGTMMSDSTVSGSMAGNELQYNMGMNSTVSGNTNMKPRNAVTIPQSSDIPRSSGRAMPFDTTSTSPGQLIPDSSGERAIQGTNGPHVRRHSAPRENTGRAETTTGSKRYRSPGAVASDLNLSRDCRDCCCALPQFTDLNNRDVQQNRHNLSDAAQESSKTGNKRSILQSQSKRTSEAGTSKSFPKRVSLNEDHSVTLISENPLKTSQTLVEINEDFDQFLKNWVQKVPVTESPEISEKARLGLYNGIWKTVIKLKMNPEAINNPFYYQEALDDEIDELLDCLPQTEEVKNQRDDLKQEVVEKAANINQFMSIAALPSSYKRQLIDNVTNNIPRNPKTSEADIILQDILIQQIVEYFIVYLKYRDSDHIKANVFKIKLLRDVHELILNLQQTQVNEIKSTTESVVHALERVPVPNEETINREAEEILLGLEIEQWFSDLLLQPTDDPNEIVSRRKHREMLTIKLHDMEHSNNLDSEQMKGEIRKFLSKVHVGSTELQNTDFMVEELVNRLKNRTEDSDRRRSVGFPDYEEFSQDLPLCSSFHEDHNTTGQSSYMIAGGTRVEHKPYTCCQPSQTVVPDSQHEWLSLEETRAPSGIRGLKGNLAPPCCLTQTPMDRACSSCQTPIPGPSGVNAGGLKSRCCTSSHCSSRQGSGVQVSMRQLPAVSQVKPVCCMDRSMQQTFNKRLSIKPTTGTSCCKASNTQHSCHVKEPTRSTCIHQRTQSKKTSECQTTQYKDASINNDCESCCNGKSKPLNRSGRTEARSTSPIQSTARLSNEPATVPDDTPSSSPIEEDIIPCLIPYKLPYSKTKKQKKSLSKKIFDFDDSESDEEEKEPIRMCLCVDTSRRRRRQNRPCKDFDMDCMPFYPMRCARYSPCFF